MGNSQQEPSALTSTSCMDTITTQIIIFNPFSSSGCLLGRDFISSSSWGSTSGFWEKGRDGWRGWREVMLMANSIPNTCQETTRGPQEELQQEAIPASPAGHRESGTGTMPTLLHLPCSTFHSQPGRKNPSVILLNSSQHQPCHDCQADYINHLLKAGLWWLFFFFLPLSDHHSMSIIILLVKNR